MNNVSQPNNGTSFVPSTNPFAIPAMVWPTQNANQLHHSESLVSVGRQTPAPYQDLLGEAMEGRNVSPPNLNIQGLVCEDGSDLHHPHSAAGSRNVRPNIDLNQPASDSNSSSPLVISSGVAGYVVEDDGEVRRLSCKRKAPEEPSNVGESSRPGGETSRLVSAEDVELPENEETFLLDNNVVNTELQQQGAARPVVIGLPAPTRQDRREQAMRARIRANARHHRRGIHFRSAAALGPETNSLWHQGVNNYAHQPQQPMNFPYEIPPGAFYPVVHPLSQLAIQSPNIPLFAEPMQPSYWNDRLQAAWVNRFLPSPVQSVQQHGYIIPDRANFSLQQLVPAQGNDFHGPHSLQHLGFSVNARVTGSGMGGGFVATTQQSFGPGFMDMNPVVRAQREMATRVAAQRIRNRLLTEVRDTLAVIRNVMVNEQADVYGRNEEQVDDHEAMHQDVEDMSFEELSEIEERNGSASTGLTDASIRANLNHYKYDSTAAASSSSSARNDTCCICQEEYADREEVSTLHCEHSYHFECITQWLVRKNNCPICKRIAIPV